MPVLYSGTQNTSPEHSTLTLESLKHNLPNNLSIPQIQSQQHLDEHKASRFKVQTVLTSSIDIKPGNAHPLSTSTQQINVSQLSQSNNVSLPTSSVSSTTILSSVKPITQLVNQNSIPINNSEFGSSTLEQLNRELRKVSGVIRSTDSQQASTIVRSSSVARAPTIMEQPNGNNSNSVCAISSTNAPCHTSLPQTPGGILTNAPATGDIVQHNLAELNEKLQALSLKQQSHTNEVEHSEQHVSPALEEAHRAASVATMLNAINGNIPPHLIQVASAVPLTSSNLARAHSVAPNQMHQLIDEIDANHVHHPPHTMPQVDTLNELASALQKVKNLLNLEKKLKKIFIK